MRSGGFLLALLAFELFAMPLARAADGELCAQAIAHNEAAGVLPAGLLTAVAVSESGRYDRDRRRVAPWPWAVNNAGDGRYFPTKDEAIHHVERLRAAGERNIDVGCMQVNLMHHPDAFASLEEAFEPSRNVAYGARFLDALRQETRSWDRAVERYHTADPERGRAYREKVYQRWARAPIAGEPDPGSAGRPRILMASLAADTAAGNVRSQALAERHKLRPLSSRGYLSIRGSPSRVAVLRPSGDRQLKPIVRPPRRSHVGLVRLTSSRRAVVALAP